ncbi:hypothetical protein [Marinobacterium stanieri]|uniref:hypothetical protein n=1 Tax=Marinobacterium stanieri TaxID=49186 RepID=UPI003A931B43
MTLLTRDQILAADDIKSEVVEVPEWGGSVRVRTMTGTARDRLEAQMVASDGTADTTNVRAKYVAAGIVDEQGEPVFTEGDIAALGKRSCAALDRVFEAVQRLSGVTNKDIEELAKN